MSTAENKCRRTLKDLTLELRLVSTSVQDVEEIKVL